MTRPERFGYGSFFLALLSGGLCLATLGAAATLSLWVPFFATQPEYVPPALVGVALVALLALAGPGSGALRVRSMPAGVAGKGRLGTLFGMTAIGVSTTLLCLVPLLYGAANTPTGFLFTITPADLLRDMPEEALLALYAVAANGLFDCLVGLVALALSFPLLPARVRQLSFALFDLAIIGGAIVAVFTLPSEPATNALGDLVWPVTRLSLLSLATLRLGLRLLPALMNGIERIGFRALVASRHLRSQKSSFLAAIGSLSILAVALSSCMLTTVLSVMGGFRADLQEKILGNHAHVVIDRDSGRIEGWESTLETARRTPGVKAATPVAGGEVMVTSASNLSSAFVRGVDTATVGEVSDLEQNLVRGRLDYLTHPERLLDLSASERRHLGQNPTSSADDESGEEVSELHAAADRFAADDKDAPERDVLPGVILGRELAKTLRVVVGDDIEVVSPLGELGPTGPMPKTRAFRVAGIFYSGMYEYDMKHVYMTLPVAQRFLNMGDAITGIEIAVRNVEGAPAVARALDERIGRGDLRVRDWQELNKNLFGALALEKLAMFVTLGIAVLIAGFCVFGTLTLMVQEKGREVGILKAMGTPSRAIIGIFLIEGLLIGIFGAALGLGLGFVVAFGAEHFGVRMNPEVYYIDRLPVSISAAEFTIVGICAVLICVLATIFPAYLASSTRPVDALRYD